MRSHAVALLSVLLLCVGSAHAAWWQGVSAALDYTPHGTQPGLTYQLLGSGGCQGCHSGNSGSSPTFFPYNTWAGSMMANATRDPVFWAALDVANHDQPGVGDYCLRCHTPQGWYGGHVVKVGGGGTIDGSNGCQLAGNYARDDGDYSGETCHFCHRLLPQGPQGQAAYTQNAAAWLDDADCGDGGGPCRRGPYDYSSGTVAPPTHPWAYSSYHTQSAQCGLCHNVSTPDTSAGPLKTLLDAAGHDTGVPFPIERTFREWQLSDFADLIFRDGMGDARDVPALALGRQCQDCHMPTSTDPSAAACNIEDPGVRMGNLPVHTLVGGNTWVPSILSGEYGAALGRNAAFTQTVAAAQQMLQNAAQVTVTQGAYVAPTPASAGSVALIVRTTNLSGHKLPTGYSEGRRMWLDVQVRDAGNALIAESGAYDANGADLDPQARVFEVLQGIWNGSACATNDGGGNPQFHFVLNDCIAKDNRIPPLGFSGGNDLETQPVGANYGGGAHLHNYDDAPYSFVLPAGTALPVSVTATLYYQTASKPYIAFLRDEAQTYGFAAENALCGGGPGRPFAVGPQSRTRAEYLYELWNDAPSDAQPGYGKSPPQVAGNPATTIVTP